MAPPHSVNGTALFFFFRFYHHIDPRALILDIRSRLYDYISIFNNRYDYDQEAQQVLYSLKNSLNVCNFLYFFDNLKMATI